MSDTQDRKETGKPDTMSPQGRKVFEAALRKHRDGEYEEALSHYALTLVHEPDNPVVLTNMGVALRSQGKDFAAEACYRRAIAINPDSPGSWTNLGNTLRRMGRLKEAVMCHRKAVQLDRCFQDGYYHLGLVLQDLGKLDEAIRLFDHCLKKRPDNVKINWDRSLALLASGDFIKGFEAYEYRWKRDDIRERHFRQPEWDGSPLNGRRILLYPEQGFGDTINFVRYVKVVADMGGKVILESQPELVSLFETLEGVHAVVSRKDKLPEFDVQAALMSVPRILRQDIKDIPSYCPYIYPPMGSGFPLHVPEGTLLKVGIAWAGKPSHKNDRNRSVGIEPFLSLAAVPGVSVYSLQKGPESKQKDEKACGVIVRDLAAGCEDFADTAKMMQQLDLVVTVDTAVAHLAGALNVPVWVIIPYNPDWR